MIKEMFADKTIEEYQLLLLRNPTAKVFAPLAEAYRKMGLLQQALEVCERGVKYNPDYVSGLVAYGKILFELNKFENAFEMFQKATQLKTDNLLAHKLMALCLVKLNRYPEALQAYKRVLFLSPKEPQALKFIANWEHLEAGQYEKETFDLPQKEEAQLVSQSTPQSIGNYVEALVTRNEIDRAQALLEASLALWPDSEILKNQQKIIEEYLNEESAEEVQSRWEINQIKKNFLIRLLRRIELGKTVDQSRPHPFNS